MREIPPNNGNLCKIDVHGYILQDMIAEATASILIWQQRSIFTAPIYPNQKPSKNRENRRPSWIAIFATCVVFIRNPVDKFVVVSYYYYCAIALFTCVPHQYTLTLHTCKSASLGKSAVPRCIAPSFKFVWSPWTRKHKLVLQLIGTRQTVASDNGNIRHPNHDHSCCAIQYG